MNAARRHAQARPASLTDASAYLAKAKEYLRAAADSHALGNLIATTGNAIHAGIAAADAIAARSARSVWKGEHSQAPAYLEQVAGTDGRDAARHLRRLLPLKSRAEYDPDPVSAAEAAAALRAAERITSIAERVVIGPR